MRYFSSVIACAVSCFIFSEYSMSAPLVNQFSNLCLEVDNASTNSAANVSQNTCTGSDHQQWTQVPVTGGFLLQAAHSGQCLDVSSVSTADGANLIQWPCHSNNNQIFNWVGGTLQVSHSNKCIDIANGSTTPGANIHQWTCNGSLSQQFSTQLPDTTVTSNSLFYDDFENGLTQWTQSNASLSGIGTHTANSASSSLYLRHDTNNVTTRVIDANVLEATLSLWVRHGSDAFSEYPDSGEDLTLSYLNTSGQWIVLDSFRGGGTAGEVFAKSYQLPRAALHSNLQLRFDLLDGSGSDFDYWHIDDIAITGSTEDYSCSAPTQLFSDDFETDLSQWSVSNAAYVGLGSHTANSGSQSAYLRHAASHMTSIAIDTSTAFEATLSLWLRRGDDSFSEDPDTNEDLQVWYLDDMGTWVLLDTFAGGGTAGEIITESYILPASALHTNLQIRFALANASGVDYDYWHIDDVELTTTDCSTINGADHFIITHDNSAAFCLAETMTVTAIDTQSMVLNTYNGTVTLDTQTGTGTWSLVSGNGVLADSIADDGLATYTYQAADNGVAIFSLYYPSGADRIDVDVYDNSARDNDSEGELIFAATGFTLTASPLSNPPVTPINDPIGVQTAGQAFNIAVAAYGTQPDNGQCGIIESYSGNKNIVLNTSYNNPTTGTLSASGSGSVSFTQGQAILPVQYNDVGQITLHLSDSSTGISGQSNPFVLKPADFSIAIDNNPASTTTGNGLVAAGESFTVNVQALNALGGVTPNYGNELSPESVRLVLDSLVFPSGGNVGVLSDSSAFTKIDSTTLQNTLVSWNEVGSIRLRAEVADSNYLGEGNISGGISDTVGRFYPSHFSLSGNAIADACVNFTYLSQPDLSVIYTVNAVNVAGAVTSNYDQGLGYPTGTLQYHAEYNDNAADLGGRLSSLAGAWSAGEYAVADTQATFARGSTRESPLNNTVIGVSMLDIDNRLFAMPDFNPATSGDCTAAGNCSAMTIGQASFYYGRLILQDSYGPETTSLPVNFHTEYWDGAQFTLNEQDSCTAIPRANVQLAGIAITTTPALTVDLAGGQTSAQFGALTSDELSMISGDARLSFTPPGVGITLTSLPVDVSLLDIPWLRFDWGQDNNDNNDTELPTATMSFKTYRGHDRVLYWRHQY